MKLFRILILSAFILVPECFASDVASKEEDLKAITQLTSSIISSRHYRHIRLDNEISQKLFDEYFKELDPNKMFFTKEDIQEFSRYRKYLDEMLIMGNNRFAFDVYKRYVKRFDQYRVFAEKQLAKPIDFTKDEQFTINREDCERPANLAALKELWRKKLKNDLLYYRLMQRAMKEELAAHKKDKKDQKEDKQLEQWNKKSPEHKILTRLKDFHNELAQKEKIDILAIYLTALARVYGPHSDYFSPKAEEDFDIHMRLSLVGIGAMLQSEDGFVKVVSLIPGGPAARDGRLKPNDKIISVTQEDGEHIDIIDMPVTKAVKYIRGAKGSKVTLAVLSGSDGGTPKQITLTRDIVQLKDSEASAKVMKLKDENGNEVKIGVITLPKFYLDFKAFFERRKDYKSSTRDVARLIDKLVKEDKIDALIMDLRSNGGGSLHEAVTLTGLFISEGPVVQVRKSQHRVEIRNDPDRTIHYSGPLLVMVNKLTSSSAEIFSGAIKDYKRGIIIGDERTYGKGTVLDVLKLDPLMKTHMNRDVRAGSLKFESAVFYRVNGESTQQKGVVPHIDFKTLTNAMEIGEKFNENSIEWDSIMSVKHSNYDPHLDEFVEILKKRSKARLKDNVEYKIIQQSIDAYEKFSKRKTISLNEDKRWKEYLKEKKVREEQRKVFEELAGHDKDSQKDDFFLRESAQILLDYLELGKKEKLVSMVKGKENIK